MAEALELKPQPDLASRVRGIEENGYAYFPQALDASQVAKLKEVMDRLTPIEASFNRHTTPDNGGFLNKHINNVFNRDPIFLQYLDGPGVIDLAEAVHGRDCHVIGMTAWVTGPGRPDQQLHCDWLPVEMPEDVLADPRVKMPVFITTAHYYLNDLYEELGPTKFIPGSHLSGRLPKGEQGVERAHGEERLVQGGGRSDVPQRGVAQGHFEPERRGPLPAAGPLRTADDYAEVPTLSEQVQVRPRHHRAVHAPPAAPTRRPYLE